MNHVTTNESKMPCAVYGFSINCIDLTDLFEKKKLTQLIIWATMLPLLHFLHTASCHWQKCPIDHIRPLPLPWNVLRTWNQYLSIYMKRDHFIVRHKQVEHSISCIHQGE